MMTDASLLQELATGADADEAAAELYRRYAHRLHALARAHCSTGLARRVDAEDIVQSVFRAFFQGARQGSYQVPDGEGLWRLLLVIAMNKIRATGAYHLAAKRDVRRTTALAEGGDEPGGEAAAFVQVAVDDTLSGLPESHRRIVALRLEGYEVAEIAGSTGRSKRSVERLLQEARRKLSAILGQGG